MNYNLFKYLLDYKQDFGCLGFLAWKSRLIWLKFRWYLAISLGMWFFLLDNYTYVEMSKLFSYSECLRTCL